MGGNCGNSVRHYQVYTSVGQQQYSSRIDSISVKIYHIKNDWDPKWCQQLHTSKVNRLSTTTNEVRPASSRDRDPKDANNFASKNNTTLGEYWWKAVVCAVLWLDYRPLYEDMTGYGMLARTLRSEDRATVMNMNRTGPTEGQCGTIGLTRLHRISARNGQNSYCSETPQSTSLLSLTPQHPEPYCCQMKMNKQEENLRSSYCSRRRLSKLFQCAYCSQEILKKLSEGWPPSLKDI